MKISNSFRFQLFGLFCLSAYSFTAANAQISTCYEAEIEVTTMGQTNSTHIVKDGVRFKYYNPLPASLSSQYYKEYLYDGNSQGIIWESCKMQSMARPELSTLISRVQILMKERGKDRVLKEYSVPKVAFSLFNSSSTRNGSPVPNLEISTSKSLIGLAMKPVGKEKVGEYLCDVMSFDGLVRGQRIRKKVWLHKASGLILRQEVKFKMEGSAPDMSRVVSVSHLKLLKSIPQSAFELPAGTTVELPETFNDVKLDKGGKLTRKKTEGDAKLIGIDFSLVSPK